MTGRRCTVEEKRALQKRALEAADRDPNWPAVALDLYLQGSDSVSDICELCGCSAKAFYTSIAKEALYRSICGGEMESLYVENDEGKTVAVYSCTSCDHVENVDDLEA
jgi:hypothetical protein